MQKILERLNPDLIDAAEALAGAPIRVPADESDEADGSDDSVRFRAAQRPDGDAEIDARACRDVRGASLRVVRRRTAQT